MTGMKTHPARGMLILIAAALLWPLSVATSGPEDDRKALATAVRQGDRLHQQGKFAEAAKEFEKAVARADQVLGPRSLNTAKLLNNLALCYDHLGRYARAEALYRRSLKITEAKLGKNDPAVATCLANLGDLYREQGRWADAEPLLKRSLQIREAKLGKDHPDVANSLNNLASVYAGQGWYTRAEPLFRRSLRIRETKLGKDHLSVGNTLVNLGTLYLEWNLAHRGVPLLRRSLRIHEARLGKDHPSVAYCLSALGKVYTDQGSYARAEALLGRSLRICETRLGKDHPRVVSCLTDLAHLATGRWQYREAKVLLGRARKICAARWGKGHPAVADVLVRLADVARREGSFAEAEELLRRSRAIFEARGDKGGLTSCVVGQAALATDQGQYARAVSLYRRALRATEAKLGKDHPRVTGLLHALADVYRLQGQDKQAEALFKRCLRIYQERLGKDHPFVAACLDNLAQLYGVQGRWRAARSLGRRALQIWESRLGKDHPDVAVCLHNLAARLQARGQLTEAEPLYRRSLRIWEATLGPDHPEVANCLLHLALLEAAQKRWDRAGRDFDRASRIVRRQLSQTLPALSEPEQLAFLQAHARPTFCRALSLGLTRRNTARDRERSAEWVLNGKAVAQQALAERTLLARDRADPRLGRTVRELAAARAHLARLVFSKPPVGREARHLREIAAGAVEERKLSRRLGQAGGRPSRIDRWVTWGEVRRALPRGGVLIEVVKFSPFVFGAKSLKDRLQPPRYVAWVISAGGQVRVIDLGAADKIEAAVAAVRRRLRQGPAALRKSGERKAERHLKRTLRDLSALVLQPLLPHVGRKKCWLVSPDAALWLVPWAALPLPDGSYAVESHEIRYLVSGRDLVRPRGQGTGVKPGPPLMLADPDFDGEPPHAAKTEPSPFARGGLPSLNQLPRFRRLPGTAVEARALAPLLQRYTGGAPTVLTGKKAGEGAFKAARRPRVVVLSTHGFFLEDQEEAIAPGGRGLKLIDPGPPRPRGQRVTIRENPLLRCGLALAGANLRERASASAEDGILTGLEIVGCDLGGTELVVLSACETALGKVNVGEGVAGLRQAFQLAGAQSVVATLWQIPDRETTALMKEFFKHLAAKKGKAEALRRAQLSILKQRRKKGKAAHPYYWAAFTLTGSRN
jgi:CHAT domain-containing protein/lipopolysaccharide biosynthesis regulator YciM